MQFNFQRRVAMLALVAGSSLVAACSDSTGSAPAPFPTATPAALAASFAPPPAGFAVTTVFPAGQAPAGTTITGTSSTTAPSSVTPLLTRRRTQDIPTNHDTLLYICLTSSTTFTATPTISATVAATISSGPFYLAAQTGTTWNTSYAGPYDEVGTTVTFDPTGPAPAITLTAGTPECFALVVAAPGTPTATPSASPSPSPTPTATPVGQTPSPSPTPTASPTATPIGQTPSPSPTPTAAATATPTSVATATATPTATPTPTPTPTATPTATPTPTPTPTPVPTVSASPASLALVGIGATYAQSTTLTQAGSAGAIAATSGCDPSVVTFSKGIVSGNSAPFTATGVSAGSCTETFTGIGGATTTVTITVTTTNVGVSAHRRH